MTFFTALRRLLDEHNFPQHFAGLAGAGVVSLKLFGHDFTLTTTKALIAVLLTTWAFFGYDIYDRHISGGRPEARAWAPLTDSQRAELSLVLSALPKKASFQVICLNAACRPLAENFMQLFDKAGWNPILVPANNFFAEPYGAVLYQEDVSDQRLKDAIEKTTKIKIERITPSTMPPMDSLFLGIHP